MWMQQGRIWHLGKIEFSVDLTNTDKSEQFKIYFQVWSQSGYIFMKQDTKKQ